MTERSWPVRRLSCDFCVGKNHCDQCSREAAERLLRCPGVEAIRLDLKEGVVWMRGRDEDALLDALDEAGLMAG